MESFKVDNEYTRGMFQRFLMSVTAGFLRQAFINRNVLLDNNKLL